MKKYLLIGSITLNVILIGVLIYFGILLKSTSDKVESLLHVYTTQQEIINQQDDQVRGLRNKVHSFESTNVSNSTSTIPDYSFPVWDDIELVSIENDNTNDTWQKTLFVPDAAFESKILMLGYEDYPNISYADNCTEYEGCDFDTLHSELPPNSYVWYEFNNVKIQIPYNPTWGNDERAVAPYIEVGGSDITWKDVDKQLTFGGPYVSGEGDLGWWPGKINMDIYTYNTIESWYEKLRTSGYVVFDVKKVELQDATIVQFGTAGLGTYKNLVYISRNNIIQLNTDESVTYDMLYDIIRTIQHQ